METSVHPMPILQHPSEKSFSAYGLGDSGDFSLRVCTTFVFTHSIAARQCTLWALFRRRVGHRKYVYTLQAMV